MAEGDFGEVSPDTGSSSSSDEDPGPTSGQPARQGRGAGHSESSSDEESGSQDDSGKVHALRNLIFIN